MWWIAETKVQRLLARQAGVEYQLYHLAQEIRKMAADFTKLDATAAQAVALLNDLAAKIAAIPPSTDAATQAHIDGLTKTLADAVAADAPPAPAPAPAPAA